MSKKHSLAWVKQQIEAEGYQLKSDRYLLNNVKLDLICPQGHEYQACWNMFQQGRRCPKCYRIKQKLPRGKYKQYLKSKQPFPV